MKTFVVTLDESQENAIRALAKTLKIELLQINEAEEDKALSTAMEEGKKYGRLSEGDGKSFLDGMGK